MSTFLSLLAAQVQDVTHKGLWKAPHWGFTVLTTRAPHGEPKKLPPGKPAWAGKYPFLAAEKQKTSDLTVHSGRAVQSRSLPRQASPGNGRSAEATRRAAALPAGQRAKTRVFIAAGNRLLRETLTRMLGKHASLDVAGSVANTAEEVEAIAASGPEILLIASRYSLESDLEFIRSVQSATQGMRIILVGMEEDENTFFQCVRAGVAGYLSRDASAEEVIAGVLAVRDGGAVCPGQLCRALFGYLAREAANYPSASLQRCLGLTRREQQLIPLVAQGLTNKEIANHFCLSEQTVKNHLYRMMQKVGVSDRLSIVDLCRTQGFVV